MIRLLSIAALGQASIAATQPANSAAIQNYNSTIRKLSSLLVPKTSDEEQASKEKMSAIAEYLNRDVVVKK